jgi:hypothetical protein
MGQEKLHGTYCLVEGGGWWREKQWDRWDKGNTLKLKRTQHFVGNMEIKFYFWISRPTDSINDTV